MSKFLYFQDSHVKGKNSINRLGNYFEDWLIKFEELLNIAKENDVEAILDGGDLFHNPIVSYGVVDPIADLVEKYKIPIYSLFGNHSALYHNVENSQNTSLGHLFKRSKYFKYLRCIKRKDFNIVGIDYFHGIEEHLKKGGLYFAGDEDKWKIAIIHAFITPKPFLPQVSHLVCDDFQTDANLVLVGHYHNEWEKTVPSNEFLNETKFLDIGCFGRNSISEAKIKPKCVLLDTEKRSYEIIELKTAKKGEEIFDLAKVEEYKTFDKSIQDFVKSLESSEFQKSNIRDTILEIARKQNVNKEITSLILNKMEVLNGDRI